MLSSITNINLELVHRARRGEGADELRGRPCCLLANDVYLLRNKDVLRDAGMKERMAEPSTALCCYFTASPPTPIHPGTVSIMRRGLKQNVLVHKESEQLMTAAVSQGPSSPSG